MKIKILILIILLTTIGATSVYASDSSTTYSNSVYYEGRFSISGNMIMDDSRNSITISKDVLVLNPKGVTVPIKEILQARKILVETDGSGVAGRITIIKRWE
jgi:hypothetical protein